MVLAHPVSDFKEWGTGRWGGGERKGRGKGVGGGGLGG